MAKRVSAKKKPVEVAPPQIEAAPPLLPPKVKDIGHDPIEAHKHQKHYGLKIAGIILIVCILAVAGVLGYIISKAPIVAPSDAPQIIQPPRAIVAPPPSPMDEVSISWAFNNSSLVTGKEVSLRGYLILMKGDDKTRSEYFIVDDSLNKIELGGLKSSDLKYFSEEKTNIYLVRGFVRKYQSTFEVDVKEITP